VLDLAVALKREVPGRTAAQVTAILRAHSGWAPDERTLQRHFARLELNARPDGQPPKAFGRFEADAPNERWTGDALHGLIVGGRKVYLFAFIDDHSRLVTGHRWGHSEDTVHLEAAMRNALASRGRRTGASMIDKLQSHYGFARTPFGRSLAPGMLHRHGTHAEAVARIGWCVTERALGVITGEVGAGKTVAVRAALATLDTSRHTIIYLGNPAVGGRGLYAGIVSALGGIPGPRQSR